MGAEAAPRDWRGMMSDVVWFETSVRVAGDAGSLLVEMCLVGEKRRWSVDVGDARWIDGEEWRRSKL